MLDVSQFTDPVGGWFFTRMAVDAARFDAGGFRAAFAPLARGVRYHIHDRVLIHGNKSIVFRD